MTDIIYNEFIKLKIKNDIKLKEYIDFCLNKNKKKHIKRKTENHHILPKSLFPEYVDLKIHFWNSSFLSYDDHYIAHSLLAEAIDEKEVIFAWWNMNTLNKKKNNTTEKLIDKNIYKNLREQHFDILSNRMKNRIPTTEEKLKRFNTLNLPDENGITGFQKSGLKISKSLKDNCSQRGERNSMFAKITVKERLRPDIKINVTKGYDKTRYIHHKLPFLALYDNEGTNYFSGWKDECINYCNSIGLQGDKINDKGGTIFVYAESNSFVKYLINTMKMAGLGKYLNSSYKVLSDEEIIKYLKNKEAPNESISKT